MGGERAKNNPKWQKSSVMLHVSGTILSFMVHHGLLYSYGGKRAKKGPKWQKILSDALHISGTIHLMTIIYGTYLWNNIFRCFFHFLKVLIFWVHKVVKGQKQSRMTKHSVCHASYLRNPSYDCHLWCKHIKW